VFPIPSAPSDANITILRAISSMQGYFVSSLAKREVDRGYTWVYGTQIYPLLALGMTASFGSSGPSYKGLLSGVPEGTEDGVSGVVISEHVEAYGLTSELVSAGESSAIESYLAEKGMDLSDSSLDIMTEYVGQEYSFVVSWIDDLEEFNASSPAQWGYDSWVHRFSVSVTFPATKMYYPLKLTSAYGERSVPMVVQVVGRADPLHFDDEREQGMIGVYHCISPSYYVSMENAWFFEHELSIRGQPYGSMKNVEFTLIAMAGPSEYLTDDLWAEPHWDAGAEVSNFFYHNAWTVVLACLIGASVTTSVVAGWIVYRPFRPDLKMFAALGTLNLLTIGGMIAGVYVFDIEKNFLNPGTEKVVWHRRKEFLAVFTILFLGIAFALHGLALAVVS
jgi:hypothetical protein